MSTLTESSLKDLLPKRNVTTPAPEVAGTVPIGPSDALIFDPDENITYDPLQRLNVNETSTGQGGISTSMPTDPPFSNTIDLAEAEPKKSSSSGFSLWIFLIAIVLILSIVVFFVVRGNLSSSSSQTSAAAPAATSFNTMYR